MRKRGFTLIELLAVIVILAIIALIATPLVLNTIEEARKGAFEQTITSVVKASELYQAKEQMNNPITECRYFSFGNDVEDVTTRDDKTYYPLKELSLKGNLPTEGEVKICSDEIVVEASDGNYSGIYDGTNTIISKGDLASTDSTTPIIENVSTPTITTKTIEVNVYAYSKNPNGAIANYYYQINGGEVVKTTSNSYIFEELSPGTDYEITVQVENKSGIKSDLTQPIKQPITVSTNNFETCSVEITPGGWSTSKIATIKGKTEGAKLEYKINDGKWYEIENNGTVELKEEASEENPTTVYCRFNDGENTTDGSSSATTTTIDTTEPTIVFEGIPTTIEQGESYSVADYLTITYGRSGGNYSCTVDNLNELSIGVNNLECEVVGNTGLRNQASINIYVFNPDYVMTEGNQLIWTWYMSDTGYTRYYHKTNEGFALVAYAYDSYTNWTFPILVSTDPTKVIYNTTGDYTMTAPLSDNTINYLGKTWYISYTGGWMSNDCTSIGGNALKLETFTSKNTLLEVAEIAAMKLLDEALKQ